LATFARQVLVESMSREGVVEVLKDAALVADDVLLSS
jgi:hypothetical protein